MASSNVVCTQFVSVEQGTAGDTVQKEKLWSTVHTFFKLSIELIFWQKLKREDKNLKISHCAQNMFVYFTSSYLILAIICFLIWYRISLIWRHDFFLIKTTCWISLDAWIFKLFRIRTMFNVLAELFNFHPSNDSNTVQDFNSIEKRYFYICCSTYFLRNIEKQLSSQNCVGYRNHKVIQLCLQKLKYAVSRKGCSSQSSISSDISCRRDLWIFVSLSLHQRHQGQSPHALLVSRWWFHQQRSSPLFAAGARGNFIVMLCL